MNEQWPQKLLPPLARELTFGPPAQAGRVTAVPINAAMSSFGGGFGQKDLSPAEGGGGGGFLATRPVAVAEVSPNGVRVHSVMDVQRIVWLGVLMVLGLGFGLFFVLLFRQRRKAKERRA